MSELRKIKWVLAHEPIELFIEGAKVFANELNRLAPDEFDIEVLTLSEYSTKYNNGIPVNKNELVEVLENITIEMNCEL